MLSHDKEYRSPFSVAASKEGKRYIGGKKDDITVIVSKINQR